MVLLYMLLNNMVSNNITPTVHCYTVLPVLLASLYKESRLIEVIETYNILLDSGVVLDHILG